MLFIISLCVYVDDAFFDCGCSGCLYGTFVVTDGRKWSGGIKEAVMVSAVKGICIFMIIVQAVLYFAPGSAYEKYIRILVGLLIVLRITEPVFGIFMDEEAKAEIQSRVMELQEELEDQRVDFEEFPEDFWGDFKLMVTDVPDMEKEGGKGVER